MHSLTGRVRAVHVVLVVRVVMRMVSVDGRRMVMVSRGRGRGGRVMGRRTAAVRRGRHRRPQVAGRADGQRRRRVVRRPGHAAVRVALVAAAAAGHRVVSRHDGQRQAVRVVAAGHAEIHRHRTADQTKTTAHVSI